MEFGESFVKDVAKATAAFIKARFAKCNQVVLTALLIVPSPFTDGLVCGI